jgi:hypothetical protein
MVLIEGYCAGEAIVGVPIQVSNDQVFSKAPSRQLELGWILSRA